MFYTCRIGSLVHIKFLESLIRRAYTVFISTWCPIIMNEMLKVWLGPQNGIFKLIGIYLLPCDSNDMQYKKILQKCFLANGIIVKKNVSQYCSKKNLNISFWFSHWNWTRTFQLRLSKLIYKTSHSWYTINLIMWLYISL